MIEEILGAGVLPARSILCVCEDLARHPQHQIYQSDGFSTSRQRATGCTSAKPKPMRRG